MSIIATDLDYLKTTIAQRSGNVITESQAYLLEARLTPVANDAGLKDVHALVSELKRNPGHSLHDTITQAMTINETSFFRDKAPFDALRDHVIPHLITERNNTRTLGIWSAAASSGQEAYSLAICLRTYFPGLAGWRVNILGTDICDEMVKRTRDGIYTQFEVNRGLPAPLLVKNFDRKGLNWQAKMDLRRMVSAQKMNLTRRWHTNVKHDIVFLRNVLIYFDQKTKKEILLRIHQSMNADGFLFLGGGETLIQMDVPFERTVLGKCVCFSPV